jgi:Txe/YoeB family toxin of Txe-Axe toxin-antitoxin module
MIKAKHSATIVSLVLASAPTVLTFVQHENGGLSQGDDSSATAILESLKAHALHTLQKSKKIINPVTEIDAILKRFPFLAQTMPPDLQAKMKRAKASTKKMEEFQQQLISDIADIDKLLGFAHLYDGGAKAPEGIDIEKSIDALIDRLFPQQPQTSYEGLGDPKPGDMVVGCGEPGCEGCGGRKMFTFNEGDTYGGIPHLTLGSIEVPAQTDPFSGVNIPEELKSLFGDRFHVIRVGGQRNTDPLKGLGQILAEVLGGSKQ